MLLIKYYLMENQNIYDLLGFVARSKTRQEVLKVLLTGDKTSKQIAEETSIIQSRASVVLKQLRDNNLISGEGKRNIVYSINEEGKKIITGLESRKMGDLHG